MNAQGVSRDKFSLIPRVLLFPVDEKGRVLLLKGARTKKIWANLWNGPGGHLEAGEGVLEAARREMMEETGLTAGKLIHCAQIVVDTGSNPGIIFFVIKAKQLGGELRNSAEGELAWFTQNQALKLDLVEDLYTLLPLVMRHRTNEKPFWGYYSYDRNDQLVMRFSR
ncbi:MAG: NUDIX domain-containing protein [Anaerolineaceae bacterium]